jgi:hypothetical protein
MTKNNPMKDKDTARRVAKTQRKNHNSNPRLWRRKYVRSKFKHWIKLSEGKNIGAQKHNSNCSSVEFFIKMKEVFNWKDDNDYFDGHPYEFPLVISKKNFICFFPDYYNKSKNLIIEWDEKSHLRSKQATQDKRRDSLILNKYPDVKIIRLPENNFSSYEDRYKFISSSIA